MLLLLAALFFFTMTETGLRTLVALPGSLSNGRLSIQSASGSLSGRLQLEGIRYTDSVDTVLIEAMELTWNPARLLGKELLVPLIHATGVRVLLGESGQETTLAPLSLPVRLVIDQISIDRITLLEAQEELWTNGRVDINHLSFQGSTLEVAQLSLISETLRIAAKGQLQTTADYPLHLSLETEIQPAGYAAIAGQATLTGPLNALTIEAETRSPFPVHLKGQLHQLLGTTTSWQAGLQSPAVALAAIHPDWPDQRFTEVVIEGQGTLASYTLDIRSQAGLSELKTQPTLVAVIKGDGSGLRVEQLTLAHGLTDLRAQGSLSWSPALAWQADISGTHLDPALLHSDWPGDFACTFTTSGRRATDMIEASLHLAELQGSLRGFPLSGKGDLHLKDNQVQIPRFLIKSGGSTLTLSGQAAATIDLAGELVSANLAELMPNSRGQIRAQGRLTGTPAKPEIDLKLIGNKLGLGTNSMEKLTLTAKGELSRQGRLDAALTTEQLKVGATVLHRGRIQLQGSSIDHLVIAEGQGADFSAGCKLQGKAGEQTWQGTLQQTRLTSARWGNWQQRQPTLLSLGPDQGTMAPLCLFGPSAGSLCLKGSWGSATNTWQAQATASSVPLDWVQEILDIPGTMAGNLNGSLDLSGQEARLVTGKLLVDGAGMVLRLPLADGAEQELKWEKNKLEIDYGDRQGLVKLESLLTDGSTMALEARLGNLASLGPEILRSPLQGTVRLNLLDLKMIRLLTDQMVQLTGSLQGQFSLSGTPAAPQLTGQMELIKGQAEIPALGITLSPLSLAIKGDTTTIRVQALAHSGKGALRAEGTLQVAPTAASPSTISLTGKDFQATHLPGLELDITPDLQLLFNKKQTSIRGTITLPRARITSIDLNQATAPSSDMIVVDDPQESTSPVTTLPLFTTVTLIAGDDVQIDTYGVKGFITGALQVIGQPDRPPVGQGTLTVQNGTFTLYGRQLKIDLGRLLFNNGPLSDPAIELRSENKDEKITTGVRVEGFLQHPEITFYSSPAMEQAAILSHLLQNTALGGETRQDLGLIGKTMTKTGLGGMVPFVESLKKFSMIDEIKLETGTSFDSASLIFGSWLTPDFYVSYGKDLLNESGSFDTRYTFFKGVSVTTETGAEKSGGDIKYEFER